MSESKKAQKDKKEPNPPIPDSKHKTQPKDTHKTSKSTDKRYNLACSADPSHYTGSPKNFNPKWKCSKCGAPIIEVGNQPTPPPVPQMGS